jgi:hypothetical protein
MAVVHCSVAAANRYQVAASWAGGSESCLLDAAVEVALAEGWPRFHHSPVVHKRDSSMHTLRYCMVVDRAGGLQASSKVSWEVMLVYMSTHEEFIILICHRCPHNSM